MKPVHYCYGRQGTAKRPWVVYDAHGRRLSYHATAEAAARKVRALRRR